MQQTLLAIDDVSLPLRKNVCLYLNKPTVRPEPVLTPSPMDSIAPDNQATQFYGTVLHDQGKFRMWYYACHGGTNPDWPEEKRVQIAKKPGWLLDDDEDYEMYQGPLCYAESDDGLTWTKPALGQVLFKGRDRNNALDLPHTIVSGTAVIRDDDEPDPARRYKMIYQYFPDQTEPEHQKYGSSPSIACAVSADGITWTVTSMPFMGQFVEHCSFIRHNGQYITHSHSFCGETWSPCYKTNGSKGGRTGIARATHDFDNWPDLWQWAFALPEPADPERRGHGFSYAHVHLGIGAASLGNVCVGVYGIWHNHPFGEDFAKISCDLGLVVSNDGVRFREVGATPGQPYIGAAGSPVTPVEGRDFNTCLCQGNGILNVGDETRIYHGRWRNVGLKVEDLAKHYYGEVALATLPRDRWGSLQLNPGATGGAVCSLPVTVPADGAFHVNADGTSAISVDLLDEYMDPIRGFSGGAVEGPDGLRCPVSWGERSLAGLAGQTVRMQVNMEARDGIRPRLYAGYVGGLS